MRRDALATVTRAACWLIVERGIHVIVIADMRMPENCQECPFSHKVSGVASCIARSRYESPANGGTFMTAVLCDGNDKQRDSFCPLRDDTAIYALMAERIELRRLRKIVKRLTGNCAE